jgi:hypothetical protein
MQLFNKISNMSYFQIFDNMHKIMIDESEEIYNRQFAGLFRRLLIIYLNVFNNEKVKLFSSISNRLIMTYFHRVVQLTNKTIDQKESYSDFNELKKLVYSIHLSLKTNKNIEWTIDSIESHLYNLE